MSRWRWPSIGMRSYLRSGGILTLSAAKRKDPQRISQRDEEQRVLRGSFAPLRILEFELLFLNMFAAVPLYGTQVIGFAPLIVFHAVMAGIVIRVMTGRDPEVVPLPLMRGLAAAYIFFYIFDAAVISRSAISASTHLVLFIAAYQPMEPASRLSEAQRL